MSAVWTYVLDVAPGISVSFSYHWYPDTINVDVSDEELARRKANWTPREPRVTTGYLARYASMVTSANEGAILKTV